jgi:hypothetical protein
VDVVVTAMVVVVDVLVVVVVLVVEVDVDGASVVGGADVVDEVDAEDGGVLDVAPPSAFVTGSAAHDTKRRATGIQTTGRRRIAPVCSVGPADARQHVTNR